MQRPPRRLAETTIAPPSGSPRGTMLFLHGILGTRANWRTMARRFVEARPEWAAMLVDLREHGDSLGLEGPDTVDQCASDLDVLADVAPAPLAGVLGHSFGGKVALAWLARARHDVREAWIIDAVPGLLDRGTATADTAFILELLSSTRTRFPHGFENREEFTRYVVARGVSNALADWLAMNLRKTEDGRRAFALDFERIRALLASYAETDFWSVIEEPPRGTKLHVVIGTRSPAFDDAARARAEAAARAHPDRVFVHPIEAGHFVHVDAPAELLALLTAR